MSTTGADWARLNATFPTHPKTLAVGPIGELIHVRAICYAARYLTDGFIPVAVIPTLLGGLETLRVTEGVRNRARIKLGQDASKVDWIGVLVRAGLWEPVEGGYRLHDYLQYNPTREEYERILYTKRENGRRGGLASVQARAQASAQAPALPSAEPPAQAKFKHVTLRNETKESFGLVSGSNDAEPTTEQPDHGAQNGVALTPEQVKAGVAALTRTVLRPRP